MKTQFYLYDAIYWIRAIEIRKLLEKKIVKYKGSGDENKIQNNLIIQNT